jgi:hypothetical protein
MATSDSTNFSLNGKEVVKEALRLIGVGVTGESLSAEEISDGLRVLNRQIKALQAEGLQLWKRTQLSVNLTDGKSTYTLGNTGGEDITTPRPLKVLSAVRENSDGGVARMEQLAYEDYWNLPDKSSKGIPVQFFFNPPVPSNANLADLVLWPTPDSTAASDWTIELVIQEPLEDIDKGSDDLDFPPYYEEALVYGLAYRLAPEYGLSLQERQLLSRDSNQALNRAMDFDVEWGSSYFQPDYEGKREF